MPRYYFHVENGQEIIRDEEGIDLSDLDAVREEATTAARQIMSQSVLVHRAITKIEARMRSN
jgi:hypothetical protein